MSVRCGALQPIEPVAVDDAPAAALEALNRYHCFTGISFVMIHAAVAAHGGRAAVLTARSGGGKSTLVAGLVRSGWDYLSDEAAAVDDAGQVHPYTRPIGLLPGSWPLFPEVADRLPAGSDRFARRAWHVPASVLGTVATRAMESSVVVDLNFDPFGTTELCPLSRSVALERLARQGLNLPAHGQAGLDRLGALVRGAACYELRYADLEAGMAAVTSVV